MKISRVWLQTFFNEPLPEAVNLADALTFHAFEIDGIEGDILDVKVTPNRGHDCLSVRGIAKELSAILRVPMKSDPLRQSPDLSKKASAVTVAVREPSLCGRYVAAHITGVNVGPSPKWLRDALESVGQKSINNVVDATNYVMFHLGQPLHAFDAGRLVEKDGAYAIGVRLAKDGELVLALDDKEYALSGANLIIVDGQNDVPIGIAGVKGGKPAGISEATKDIIIESAHFDGVSVRKTAAALKLRTDASSRFEQGISPELAAYGIRAAADLILELAAGELQGFVDEYPSPLTLRPVSVSLAKVNDCLGTVLTEPQAEDVFTRLGFSYEKNSETYAVVPPFERLDLAIPEDLIEEVGRVVGYEAVPEAELPPLSVVAVNKNFYYMEQIRELLVSRGFSEVFTSVFADSGERHVLNKVGGGRSFLRSSLIPGLVDAVEKNNSIQESIGLSRVRLFEIGTVWKNSEEHLMLGVAATPQKKQPKASAVLDEVLGALGASAPGLDGDAAEISLSEIFRLLPELSGYDDLPLSGAERYAPYSKYPHIVRDVSFWAPAEADEANSAARIREAAGELARRVDRFDRFEKDGRVSFAFRIVLQAFDRTLTDEEASAAMERVHGALTERGFEIR